MRTKEEMLKNTHAALRRYGIMTTPEDMLAVRLAADVTELLTALAEEDAEIEALKESRMALIDAITEAIQEQEELSE